MNGTEAAIPSTDVSHSIFYIHILMFEVQAQVFATWRTSEILIRQRGLAAKELIIYDRLVTV